MGKIQRTSSVEPATDTIILLFSFLFLFIGLTLDLLTIIWAYNTVYKNDYKSGNFIIPALFYVLFILTTNLKIINEKQYMFTMFFILFHLFVYLLLPYIFGKIYNISKNKDN